ncbi:MAG: FAD-dependent monooxygenase [Promicromonosporaceae bacterium]|nr:FAD-dependent monooxygenase [Promicromonosporaceae bacterium]
MGATTHRPLHVGIVGAGICGLTLAAGLRRHGHDVTLYERAPRLMPVGAGISISPQAVRALTSLGLAEPVLGDARSRHTTRRAALLRPDGSAVLRATAAHMPLLPMTRSALHAALAEQAGDVVLGVDAQVSASGAPVVTVDGVEHEFDVVVASDGVRSAARERLGLDPGLRYAGWTTWRGVTAEPFDLRGQASETWGPGAMVGLVPLLDGHAYWFAAQHAPPGTTVPDPRGDALGRFGDWHLPIRLVIEACDPQAVVRTDVYDLAEPLTTYVRGRVALAGDAAHPMTPNLGQGANQAIVDAASLVRRLESTGVVPALMAYDNERRHRSQRVARASRAMGQVALAEGMGRQARDRVLGAMAAVTRAVGG